MIAELLIEGNPVTKKNSQRIFKNQDRRPFIMQSAQYKLWADKAYWQLRTQWKRPALSIPLNMSAIVYREREVGDLLNYLAAISDVLEDADVIKNDNLIVSVDGCRFGKNPEWPHVAILLSPVDN